MINGQSFSASVREELIRLPLGKSCCMLSELSALTQTSGHLFFRGAGRMNVQYRLASTGTARRLFRLLKARLNISATLHFIQMPRLGGQRVSVLTLSEEDTRTLLSALHMLEEDEDGMPHLRHIVPRHPMTRQCCRKAFLRGAFLGAGSMSNPEKGYHLEWKADDDHLRQVMERLLEKCGMPCHVYERRGKPVIYFKGAEEISDMLALMGAASSVLKMENIRINRQMRGVAARAANCDEHNSEKMLDAARRQAEDVRYLSMRQGLFTLPPALRELARKRIENPELSLKELGEAMDPPLSKSAVNHRMRRLTELAEELKSAEAEEKKRI